MRPETQNSTRIEWIEKYLAEAEQLIYANNVEGGLELMNNLLYEEPGYGTLHNYLGWAYLYYTPDIARAELHLKMAMRFNEMYAPPYLHLGTLYIRAMNYKEAIAILEKGLVLPNANRYAFLDNIAQAYELNGEYKNAINAYKTALKATVGHESNTLMESIKRCRKKRLTLFFSF
jgi:tetratricopeptide (TPR) repeat protein